MSSEQLADGVNPLDAELAATWDILKGYSGRDTDLGIARRFGGAAAAYSLRDIGAMNGRVVRVRRDSDDAEEDFSANQIDSGALETFVQDGADYSIFASDETAFRFLNERSSGTSASSDLTQFTLDVQTASGYAGAKFNEDVTLGDSIYVSFNASLDEGSATASPKVGLRNIDSALNGTLYSNEGLVTEGFNSFKLTSTNSTASGIVWSEGDDNVIFTITDIKVSRIARNGFVETWYDQSGNGRDMAQTTAADQPHIVENGGICKDPSGNNPTVKFVNVGTNLGSTFLTATPISGGQNPFTHLLVASSTNTGASGQTFVGCIDGVDLRLSTLAMRMRSGNQNRTTGSNSLTSNTNSLLTYIRASGRVPKMALNNNALEIETATADAGSDDLNEIMGENTTSASNDTFGLVGTISESILYTSDKDAESELSDLKTDINNHYNTF